MEFNLRGMQRLGFCLLLFILYQVNLACSPTGDQVVMHSVNGVWLEKEPEKFALQITDVQKPKNIIFVVRNNDEYPYLELPLEVVLKDEAEKMLIRQKVNLPLADQKGKWLGQGFGDTKERSFTFKKNYIFASQGLYTLELKQVTNRPSLEGIEDLGVMIQTVDPNNGE